MHRFQRYGFSASIAILGAVSLSACATIEPKYAARTGGPSSDRSPTTVDPRAGDYKVGKPYQVRGQWYYPAEQPNYDETGIASWYGDAFHGKPTANGEIFDMSQVSAAHKTLPLPSLVEVTNLDNGRSMQLRVNDRGPFVDNRIIDLSRAAAAELGVLRPGLARVRVRYVGQANIPGQGRVTIARAAPAPAPVPAAPEPVPVVSLAAARPVITQTELAPPQDVSFEPAPPTVASASGAAIGSASVLSAYQVQAGAFSNLANAERVATQLAEAGIVEILPLERNGATLYRVLVRDIAGEAEAGAVRDKVVQIGLIDARIINPF